MKQGVDLLTFPHTRGQQISLRPSSAGERKHILLVYWLGIFFCSLAAGKFQLFSLWIHCKGVGQAAANKAALSHLHAVDINL